MMLVCMSVGMGASLCCSQPLLLSWLSIGYPIGCCCCLQVKPIAVGDMLALSNPGKTNTDTSGMTAAVQSFLNNVIAAAGYGYSETPEQLKQSVAAAMLGPKQSVDLGDGAYHGEGGLADSAAVAAAEVSDDEEEDEHNTFHLAGSGSASYGDGVSSAAEPAAGDAAPAPAAAARADSGNVSSSGTAMLPPGVVLLLKDAFLVFRALCKLSIRTSDLVTVSDPTAVRGKVRRGCYVGADDAVCPDLRASDSDRPDIAAGMQLVIACVCCPHSFMLYAWPIPASCATGNVLPVLLLLLQVLALELLKVLLENSGPTFRSSERFTAAIRQYLCLSLLKNSASSIPAALQLSASIFLSLLQKFRAALKAEVGVFFPMVMLKVLEPLAAGASGAATAAAQTGLAVNSYSYK